LHRKSKQILCSTTFFSFFRKSRHLRSNVEKYSAAEQATDDKWGMRMACCMPKGTNTHSICNTHCFSTTTMVARTHLNVTLYVPTVPVLFYFLMMDCSSYSDQGSYQKQSNVYQMKHSSSQNFASFF
jgi:hypothetical protein